ncbi:hypothetical protein Ahy_Scaffold1g106720 isoform A [Arachis hypogaea]|uniref:Uncharacterized protein n=1 Tax=Arachis hypogaea TaxID=3818 RepID=A0A444WRL2_ARAHY|nr:hypothetical protein Ahy_Scaffold1g106720 isoform A [Arachis hypogaea]
MEIPILRAAIIPHSQPLLHSSMLIGQRFHFLLGLASFLIQTRVFFCCGRFHSFSLMLEMSTELSTFLLILQRLTGIFVLIYGFVERKQFSADISKLGSSFSIVPFVTVVSVCTILTMIATLPVAQLFFFHILFVEKC